jgi:hypothetical protein
MAINYLQRVQARQQAQQAQPSENLGVEIGKTLAGFGDLAKQIKMDQVANALMNTGAGAPTGLVAPGVNPAIGAANVIAPGVSTV